VEEDSLTSKKGETKKQLKQKLDERPEKGVLVDRGILPKEEKEKKVGSVKGRSGWGSGKGKESSSNLLPGSNDDKKEKRKSSVFGRTKSTKLSVTELSQSIIGTNVIDACERDGGAVPKLVEQCIAYLYKAKFDEPGIFRISGEKSRIDQLVAEFDKGNPSPLEGIEDVHTVTSLLKLFFRLAPTPLFTLDAHAALLAALSSDVARSVAT
jgi:hypothetical protein